MRRGGCGWLLVGGWVWDMGERVGDEAGEAVELGLDGGWLRSWAVSEGSGFDKWVRGWVGRRE